MKDIKSKSATQKPCYRMSEIERMSGSEGEKEKANAASPFSGPTKKKGAPNSSEAALTNANRSRSTETARPRPH